MTISTVGIVGSGIMGSGLAEVVARAGLTPPGRFAGWRSWARLITLLPSLRSESGRAQWCWIAGVRMGHLRGSVRDRTVFL